jgi:Tol biopolymer transport system component
MAVDSSVAPRTLAPALVMVAALAGPLSATSGFTTLVSVSTGGVQGIGHSGAGNITADGRYVTFFSTSNTLAPEDTDTFFDVFVRDLLLGTTTLVSVASDGTKGLGSSSWPFITDDGRYVVFQSDARNLVPGGTNGRQHIFVRDRQAGITDLVSVSTQGAQATQISDIGNISADGRYVVFSSYASNLVARDTNGSPDVFIRDRLMRTTQRVSVSSQGQQANGSSFWARISANGRFVAFVSVATNIVGNDANGTVEDIYVRDLQTGTVRRVSVSSTGVQGNSVSTIPFISHDGRYVAFTSFARNLVPNDTNLSWDVFLRDLQAGTTERVSLGTNGAQGNHDSQRPYFSPDLRFVAFDSLASNMVDGDTNGRLDVFVRDRLAGTTSRVSVSSSGEQGNAHSDHASVSADGQRIAFHSSASNMVPGDINGERMDVFLHELAGLAQPTAVRRGLPTGGGPLSAAGHRAAQGVALHAPGVDRVGHLERDVLAPQFALGDRRGPE